MKELQTIEIQLNESRDKQVSLADPDACSMKTRGTGIVCHNVQATADTQYHLIVAHKATNTSSDRDQLSSMAKRAREATASDTLSVAADRGYFKSEQILACHDAGTTAMASGDLLARHVVPERRLRVDSAEKVSFSGSATLNLVFNREPIQHC